MDYDKLFCCILDGLADQSSEVKRLCHMLLQQISGGILARSRPGYFHPWTLNSGWGSLLIYLGRYLHQILDRLFGDARRCNSVSDYEVRESAAIWNSALKVLSDLQTIHREHRYVTRWCGRSNLQVFGPSRTDSIRQFTTVAASQIGI